MNNVVPQPSGRPGVESRRPFYLAALLGLATWALIIAGLMSLASGCSSGQSAAIGGALAGGAAANTFAGMQADLESARAAKLTELQAAVDQLSSVTDETEKAALEAKVASLEKTIDRLQQAAQAVELGEQATGLNWNDLGEVGAYGGSVLGLILSVFFGSKAKSATAKYQSHKAGVEAYFKKADAGQSADLYNLIGEARARNGVM